MNVLSLYNLMLCNFANIFKFKPVSCLRTMAEQHLKRAEKKCPKNLDHQRADEIRERIINLKLAVYKGLKQYGNVRSILEQKIKKENDPDKVGF